MKRRYIILILGIGAILLLMIGEDREPTAQNKNSYVTQDINTFKYLGELNTEDDFKIAARYDLLILNEGEAVPEKISKIRSYNPNVKIILYTMSEDLPNPNHPFFREHPEIHPSLQKMYEDINKNHPEYFLLDSNGKRIYLWVYDQMFKEHYPNTEEKPGHCLDPRTGWANYYKDYVLNSIARGIYDGVYSDAAMSYEEMKDEGNIKYWKVDNGPEEWNQAVHKMLKGIEDSLGEDAITIYNNGYNLWIDVYDGRLFEWFLSNWDYATLGGEQWLLHIQSAKETVESGKMLFAMQYGNTDEDRMYGLTSFLLIANDKSYYSFNEQSVDDQTPWLWYPEYETEI
ncbi:MAG: putative glycoside hydrolase, partial [Candidatus Methanofastidiosia archaeon]